MGLLINYCSILLQGHNVVLISNHQTEADPAVIALLLELTHLCIAENMVNGLFVEALIGTCGDNLHD